jgi:hypothetical protein
MVTGLLLPPASPGAFGCEPSVWLRSGHRRVEAGGWGQSGFTSPEAAASRSQPVTDGRPPAGGVWRRLGGEPGPSWTREGALTSVRCSRLDTAGPRGFSGARTVPGADVWRERETSMSLEPDGWLVRRHTSRRHGNDNTDASEITNRGWGLPIGTQRKKLSKVVSGGRIAS